MAAVLFFACCIPICWCTNLCAGLLGSNLYFTIICAGCLGPTYDHWVAWFQPMCLIYVLQCLGPTYVLGCLVPTYSPIYVLGAWVQPMCWVAWFVNLCVLSICAGCLGPTYVLTLLGSNLSVSIYVLACLQSRHYVLGCLVPTYVSYICAGCLGPTYVPGLSWFQYLIVLYMCWVAMVPT